MKFRSLAVTAGIASLAATLAACGTIGGRATWYPQAPAGDLNASSEPARATPRPAAPRTADAPSAVAQAPAAAPRAATPTIESSAGAGAYTQSTRYGDLVFVSGQIGMDLRTNAFNEAATVEQQTRQVMENIREVLAAHRLTLANVVSVTVYMRSLNDFRAMNTAYESFFPSHLPARSVVEVSRLPRNAAVEISIVAGR